MSLAFVFPGQGSQSIGMQAELVDAYPEAREVYAEASDRLGYDLRDVVQAGPQERLDSTVVTQPAMLTAGVAAWRVWQSCGGASPSHAAGHSLGEYTALVCAGALDFGDAVLLVRRRAELMQGAVPQGQGAMAAILGLGDDEVRKACETAANGQVVSAVNFNSPGQVVIAGEVDAVARAIDAARSMGAKRAMLLSVSVPSHCDLMRPAADQLARELGELAIAAPAIPVISNVDVTPYRDADDIRAGLARQLYSPVRWAETIGWLARHGASRVLECGPGKVLTGLTRRIDKSLAAACLESPAAFREALEAS